MSIVKGTSGYLTVSADLISSNAYTIFTGVKITDNTQFGEYLRYYNASPYLLEMSCWSGPHRHRAEQEFNSTADDTTNMVENAWEFGVGKSDGDSTCDLSTNNGDFSSGGSFGTFQTPSSPSLEVLNDSVVGDKIGVIAIYSSGLDATDIAHLLGGGDPTDLPSATAPTEMWIDSEGVADDGSGNLTSWTGINGTVLSPSGTVTIDNNDMVPVTYSSSGATAGISNKTLERQGVAISATAADVFVWSGHDVDIGTTTAALKVLGATITSGVLQEIDLSSTSIAPSDNITVAVVPDSVDPGIVIETTAEDIA